MRYQEVAAILQRSSKDGPKVVNITYVKKNGALVSRLVEPLSFRRSSEGILLFVNSRSKRRMQSFLVSRIRRIAVTILNFVPKYPVELIYYVSESSVKRWIK